VPESTDWLNVCVRATSQRQAMTLMPLAVSSLQLAASSLQFAVRSLQSAACSSLPQSQEASASHRQLKPAEMHSTDVKNFQMLQINLGQIYLRPTAPSRLSLGGLVSDRPAYQIFGREIVLKRA